jgi:hypothetical protein
MTGTGTTPGQAAYVVVAQRDDSLWLPWPELSDEGRAVWEAAAAAGAASAHERTAELLGEVNELREEIDRLADLARGNPDPAVAFLESQADHFRELLAEILGEFTGDDRAAAALVTPERLAKWRDRAGLAEPVATSGTEHLVPVIARLAIPDEDPS